MNFKEYQTLAERTFPNDTQKNKLANFAMGLVGEGGEVVDGLKKHIFHGHELDRENIVKELGDTLWYLTGIASTLNITISEVAEKNITKLQKRYPNGFSVEDSVKRADVVD
ncbi:nucleoside triphosphate pyrophosphohydrolase family protein [Viridibacillus arvi]|uniref:nucleoside triphosphate pyrophosphohydrolase family protein n=1 Tax=Viridibacillus arvi TaxID=263475 RepID=UPI0034CDB9E2